MAQQFQPAFTIFRRPRVQAETGDSRSTLYAKISRGLFPKPVRLGPRSVGWPAREVAAVNEARIAGESDAQLRELVQKLLRARYEVPRREIEQHRVVAEQVEAVGR